MKEGRFLLTSRDYIGEFIYENGTLKKILFDGGYVDMIGDTPVYMFFLRDHLGSVRAVVSQTGAVQQTNGYFPYADTVPDLRNGDDRERGYLKNPPVTGGCKTDTNYCKTDNSYSKTGSGSGLSYPDAAADAEGRGRGDSVKAAKFLDCSIVVDGYPSESVS